VINLEVEGLKSFEKLLKDHSNENLEGLKVVIYNNTPYADILEYGSIPGQQPWPSPGKKTELRADVFAGPVRVVSIQGFAMIRKSLAEAKKTLIEELKSFDLSKEIRPQLGKAMNKAGIEWEYDAKFLTPEDSGEAKEGWKIVLIN
jgi:hypothetical protein